MLRVNLADLPDAIRAARLEADLSQVEFAQRLGVSVRTVQNWEAGRVPQFRHRRLLADFLDNGKKAA